MAQNTVLNFTLNARDWESVIGIVDGSSLDYIRQLRQTLITYWGANGNPQGATSVTISTKEKTLVKIFEMFYGNTVRNLVTDSGGNPFNRVVAAVRAANNIADNYISTQLAAIDVISNNELTNIRKNGRAVLMMESYDSN